MRIGVVSDTHGNVASAREAANLLSSFDVELVLHCGDIGSTDIPSVFAAWPTHYVWGNVDYDLADLRRAIKAAGGTAHEDFAAFDLEGRKIALLHSHDRARFEDAIGSGAYDLVCYGHTHKAKLEQVGPTWVLNPGALHRANPHTLAIVELPEIEVQHVNV